MKELTDLEAAYVRVFEHTRQMIIQEIGVQAARWQPNSPAVDTAARLQRAIRSMPTPVPAQAEGTQP